MANSFKDQKLVAQQELQRRLDEVKPLAGTDTESYRIVKDRDTGEHYLHYAYMDLHVALGGEKEIFHQLMPLEHDDVLAIALGEQPYIYPDHWGSAFLRNGPDGNYVWFDPSYAEDEAATVRQGEQLIEKLKQFKQHGEVDEASVAKLLNELDRLWDKKDH